ncbi:hypothetical protein SAMN05421823_1179 [Catalinimonas alkaloidigena]|uniref:Lipocalin-like domain-containing protein n=1 Tax=Catalinimonas alkaloidigena TaxID=1075417 RepID=A0A1G9ULX7_9BACT|nr:hypothetical protein [Catalinimonas alkaloidigena]SDM60888.1 hypothetical protein SAMN05421823_1179 [Catalinimonas alkaloidigena]
MTLFSKSILLLSLGLLCAACQPSEPEVQRESGPPSLVGQWTWVESVGGMMPNPTPVTPATAGFTETLVFEAGGTFQRLRDGAVEETKGYALRTDTLAGQVEYTLVFADESTRTLRFPAADTLVIDERAYDGPASTYVRRSADGRTN